MSTTERLSISLPKARTTQVRDLVDSGTYPSLSAAVDAALSLMFEQDHANAVWWAETERRCAEAETQPDRMLDRETFHTRLKERLTANKKALPK